MKRILLATSFLALGLGTLGASDLQVDLTAVGGGAVTLAGGTTTGSIFDATAAPTTVGTGVIDSFVRVQANGTAEGYNTDAKNPGVEDDQGGIFTHSITIGSLDTTTKVGFFTFLLDINQTSQNGNLLSLDQLQLFYADVPDIETEPGAPTGGGIQKVWDFQDATSCSAQSPAGVCTTVAGNNELLLNYNNNKGSGNGFDMFFFVPTTVFAGISTSKFVYLYSHFGGKGGDFAENDGFEEWAQIRAGAIPEPSYVTGLAIGGFLLFLVDRRRRQRLNNPA